MYGECYSLQCVPTCDCHLCPNSGEDDPLEPGDCDPDCRETPPVVDCWWNDLLCGQHDVPCGDCNCLPPNDCDGPLP